MLMLWAGQLRQLLKEEEVCSKEVRQLREEKQQLTVAAIAKLSQEHERLLQELRQTRKRLREELEKSGGEDHHLLNNTLATADKAIINQQQLQALIYLQKTAEVRLADEQEESLLQRQQQGASPPRGGAQRKLPLRNNYLSPSSSSRRRPLTTTGTTSPARTLALTASPVRGSPTREISSSNHHDSNSNSSSSRDNRTGSPARTAAPQPRARFDLLPILTSTGESVFEVGLNSDYPATTTTTTTAKHQQPCGSNTNKAAAAAAQAPPQHLLPVFRLPTVTTTNSSVFVNRIPRDESVEEKAVKAMEEEEFAYMRQALGLTTEEILDLERMLGLRDPSADLDNNNRTNSVRRFMQQQLALPPLPTKQIQAAAYRGRRRKRHVLAPSSTLLLDLTPRCLKDGGQASSAELKEGLEQAMQVLRSCSSAIKEDVLSIKSICPITNPRARRFLKQWGAEKLARILEDLLFSIVVIAWERWKQKVTVQKKVERIASYLKFQASQKLRRFFENWAKRHTAGAWEVWVRLVLKHKQQERKALELRSVRLLQRVFRGHRARRRVDAMKKQRRAIFERAAAVRIQSLFRGANVRKKIGVILRSRAENHAAITIQAAVRGKLARDRVREIRRKAARLKVASKLQCLFRGNRDRRRVAAIRLQRLRLASAIKIQRMVRRAFAKKVLERMKRHAERVDAATVIQKHIRACLARERVRRLRRTRAERRAREEAAALKIQAVYRGHKARIQFALKIRAFRRERNRVRDAAVSVQRAARGFVARRQVARMRREKVEGMYEEARLWVEMWSDLDGRWCYRNAVVGEVRWEPPKKGYTKADGRLVLETGQVVDDPLSKMTEEEKEEKRMQKVCVECEDRDANRLCRQCNDRYCTPCFNKTHAGGKRAAHTFVQIGPIDCSECEKEVAVRWCTSCDDPFCTDCWSLIHLRGKRVRHAYCEIDAKGNVSNRAVGPQGEDAGTFKTGQNGGGGYSSDYGNDAYNSDYPGAEGFFSDEGVSSSQESDEWSQYTDNDGNPYWYNSRTGVSQYNDPRSSSDQQQGGAVITSPTAAGGGGVSNAYAAPDAYTTPDYTGAQNLGVVAGDASGAYGGMAEVAWAQYADENGIPYWYNSVTGESTYSQPTGADAAATAAYGYGGGGGDGSWAWAEYYDEGGNVYYYNTQTGQSQYERPY